MTGATLGAPLTEREVGVLALAAEGLTNARIGRRLHLTEDTIKVHCRRAFIKLGASDRTHAVVIALHRGLLFLTARESEPGVLTPTERDREVAAWNAMTPAERIARLDQLAAATPNGA